MPVLAGLAERLGCGADIAAEIDEANTTAQAFELARAAGARLGDAIAAQRLANRGAVAGRHRNRAGNRPVRPRRENWSAARRLRRSGAHAAEPPRVIRIVERAFAEILRRQRPAHQDQSGALDAKPLAGGPAISPSVPCTICSSGQLTRTITATGQSAP